MQIKGFNKTTLLDYPRHLAATIFLGGCNMRCPFCHNASLVTKLDTQPSIPEEEVLAHLTKRKNILEGVCITGGEPTLYADLPALMKKIKAIGLKIKLDTNGSNPTMLKSLVNEQLIDYIAMDIKNSKEKYSLTTGIVAYPIEPINESIHYLLSSSIDYEFRTTVVKEHHNEHDMVSIGQWIQGAKAYFLQPFKDSGDILTPGLSSPLEKTMLNYQKILTPYIEQVSLRG